MAQLVNKTFIPEQTRGGGRPILVNPIYHPLDPPDTWEVALSGGADKKEAFERLLREGKLGGLAVLRNLRNMQQAGVDESLIRARLAEGCERALPFRFITAARYAPQLEDALEAAMFKVIKGVPTISGRTGILVDVSGSMEETLSQKSEATRIDAGIGLAILAREIFPEVVIASFSNYLRVLPSWRGFALRDSIDQSQVHGGTYLGRAISEFARMGNLDRLIVITDEQAHDTVPAVLVPHAYIVNVACYQNGVGYGNGYHHIDGWSERILDYIREYETQ